MVPFHPLILALAAYAIPIALGHGPTEERAAPGSGSIVERDQSTSAEEIQLSLIRPFEPWPGFFEGKGSFSSRSLPGRSLKKRGPESSLECFKIEISEEREHLGAAAAARAWCIMDDPARKKFGVDCVQPGDHNHGNMYFPPKQGECKDNTMCVQFRTMSHRDQTHSTDINCVDRDIIRQWAVDATKSQQTEFCSPSYVNNVENNQKVKMALQVNTLDDKQKEPISPATVFYKMDGKKIGTERAHDAFVGSGIVEVPHGSKIQACVQGIPGQILWAIVGLTALLIENVPGKGS